MLQAGTATASTGGLVASYAAWRRTYVTERFAMIPHDRHPGLFPLFFSRSAFLVIRCTSATLDLSGSSAATIVVPLDAPAIGSSAGSAGALALRQALTLAQGFAGGLYEESQRERATLLDALGSLELLTSAAASPVRLDMQLRLNVQHNFASGYVFPATPSGALSLALTRLTFFLSSLSFFSFREHTGPSCCRFDSFCAIQLPARRPPFRFSSATCLGRLLVP